MFSGAEQENVIFWINKTEKIDILSDLPTGNRAVRIAWNMISFQLQPQYEGTFYCGKNSTDKCAGVGPIAGMIASQLQCIYELPYQQLHHDYHDNVLHY